MRVPAALLVGRGEGMPGGGAGGWGGQAFAAGEGCETLSCVQVRRLPSDPV